MACPTVNCEGELNAYIDRKRMFNYGQVKLTELMTKCTKCKGEFCKDCKKKWHPGTVCEQESDTVQWNMIGSSGKANRCPKCKIAIEKNKGCMHMTCAVCRYEWCWVCGGNYRSVMHYAQLGGLGCTMLGAVSMEMNNRCLRYLLTFSLLVFFPVLVLVGSLAGGGAISHELLRNVLRNSCRKIARY